jgi:UDP:flavonoid glycosyltransferase YjiC (YdhE family)
VPGLNIPSDYPPQVHFIGPLLPETTPNFTPPPWWNDLDQELPVIHVTQGTVATDPEDLIIPTPQALKEKSVLVVVTWASHRSGFSERFLFRKTQSGAIYTNSSRVGYRWYKVAVGFKQQLWQAFTN